MANTDKPRGLQPRKTLSGAPFTNLIRKATVAARGAGVANRIGIGDPIAISTTGVVTPTVLGAGNNIAGVVVGVGVDGIDHGDGGMFNPDNLELRYLEDTQAGFVWYVPANDVLFEVQAETGLANLTVGSNRQLTPTTGAHVDATSGWSTVEIDTATTTPDVQLIEEITAPDNDVTLENAKWLVRVINAALG